MDATNSSGQTPLHLSCAKPSLADLTKELLASGGADPCAQTIMDGGGENGEGSVYRRNPVHVAVAAGGGQNLALLLESPSSRLALDAKDSDGHTPLSLALSLGMLTVATELLKGLIDNHF